MICRNTKKDFLDLLPPTQDLVNMPSSKVCSALSLVETVCNLSLIKVDDHTWQILAPIKRARPFPLTSARHFLDIIWTNCTKPNQFNHMNHSLSGSEKQRPIKKMWALRSYHRPFFLVGCQGGKRHFALVFSKMTATYENMFMGFVVVSDSIEN